MYSNMLGLLECALLFKGQSSVIHPIDGGIGYNTDLHLAQLGTVLQNVHKWLQGKENYHIHGCFRLVLS